MRLSEVLHDVRRLYVDTAPLIYYIEEHPAYVGSMDAVFAHLTSANIQGVCSVLTLTEVLVVPLRTGSRTLISEYRDILLNSRELTCLPITENIAQTAAELRATFNIRTPDALHLATAIRSGCEAFLTNDDDLARVNAIRIILLSDFDLENTTTEST